MAEAKSLVSKEHSSAAADPVALGVRDLSKSFGGVAVLKTVSLELRSGEVHALLGENGAGKSTLVKVMAGVVPADSGEVYGTAHADGDVFMVFQELSVVPQMSVLDNLVLASRGRRGPFVPFRRLRRRAQECLARAGLGDVVLSRPVESLALAQRQLLEIARGLIADARVLILDEPTATLSDVEIAKVHHVARSLCAAGTSVVYITHRLGEVFEVADRVTVMRGGRVVAGGEVGAFDMPTLITEMLGAEHEQVHRPRTGTAAVTDGRLLQVRELSMAGRFGAFSAGFTAGEITAVFGQIGSGADDVARVLAGMNRRTDGAIELDGEPLRLGNRTVAQREGVSYISPDRVNEGVFLDATVAVNVSSGALQHVTKHRMISRAREREFARTMATRVALDPARVGEPVHAFSGGNQQKVAIARALAADPTVLILDEPTRGVDIGARSEIYRRIRALAEQGVIVVAYSSDIVEIRELADRVITMYRGAQVSSHLVSEVDDAQLMAEILHGGTS